MFASEVGNNFNTAVIQQLDQSYWKSTVEENRCRTVIIVIGVVAGPGLNWIVSITTIVSGM